LRKTQAAVSWLLTNLPKPSEATLATGSRLVRPLLRQHAYAESVSYATRAARQASDFNPVRIFHEVFLETRFAQEVSVLL
jgi:hypothetical protein